MKNIEVKKKFLPVNFSIATISDSRDLNSDKSGEVLKNRIKNSGHILVERALIKDNVNDIKKFLKRNILNKNVQAVISTGGTGLTGRDSTPEAFKQIIDKEIPGFGEIFRAISFKKIGTSALQSRAIGGISSGTFLFALPGSPSACKDAWDNILSFQFDNRFKPCNLVELLPRLMEK